MWMNQFHSAVIWQVYSLENNAIWMWMRIWFRVRICIYTYIHFLCWINLENYHHVKSITCNIFLLKGTMYIYGSGIVCMYGMLYIFQDKSQLQNIILIWSCFGIIIIIHLVIIIDHNSAFCWLCDFIYAWNLFLLRSLPFSLFSYYTSFLYVYILMVSREFLFRAKQQQKQIQVL